MGFTKSTSQKEIAIKLTHPWYPGAEFTFHFPKRLPESALNAEKQFLGLKDDEREEQYRKGIINVVAEMVVREPEGFDDFTADTSRPLAERMRDYFDDPEQPELEAILVSAWRAYRAAAMPSAYLKSPESGSAKGNVLSA
jgi:hypothetical protein